MKKWLERSKHWLHHDGKPHETPVTAYARPSCTFLLLDFMLSIPSPLHRRIWSITLLGIPFGISAIVIAWGWKAPIFQRSAVFGLVWLIFSPMLIEQGYRLLAGFFDSMKDLMKKEDWQAYETNIFRQFFSPLHLFFSVPVGFAFGYASYHYSLFCGFQKVHLVWNILMFGMVGFVSGIGFWGVSVMFRLVDQLSNYPLEIDSAHPDRFGGLRIAGSLLVYGTALFYSGSLLIPFTLDVLRVLAIPNVVFVTYVVFLGFIGTGLFSFLGGIGRLHRLVFNFKVQIAKQSSKKLLTLLENNVFSETETVANVLKPLIYFHCHHSRIDEMKEYPYDTRTILELAGSVLIPVVVFVLDRLLR